MEKKYSAEKDNLRKNDQREVRVSRFINRPVKVSKYSTNDYIFSNETPNGLAKLIASQNTCARSYYSTFAIIRRANRKGGASRSNGVKAKYDANLCRRKDVPLFLFLSQFLC